MMETRVHGRHQVEDEAEMRSRLERRGGRREMGSEVRDYIEMKGSGLQLILRT